MPRTTLNGVSVIGIAVLLSLAAQLALPADGSARRAATNPPKWVRAEAVCADVDLTSAKSPSGVSGPLAGGYNVYLLRIVSRKRIGCKRSRILARRHWTSGKAAPLHWRQRRSWRSTTGGSGWVGDYVGRKGRTKVEYLAIH